MTIDAIDMTICPNCGDKIRESTWTEQPILRHGGYGAARKTVRQICDCGYAFTIEISEVKP